MKKTVSTILQILFVVFCLNAQTSEVPKIIKSTPTFGACSVDASLKEIVLEFDQDMSGGMSVINCDNMPEIAGKCFWKDKRTFVLPVKLYAGHLYHLLLNSWQYRGFQSEKGMFLPITDFYFCTKKDDKLQTQAYKEGFDKFSEFFTKQYSHKDLRGIDWKKEFDAIKEDMYKSESNTEYAIKLWSVLRKAEDVHLKINVENQTYSCTTSKILPNSVSQNAPMNTLTNAKRYSWAVQSGQGEGCIYLAIKSLNNDFRQQIYEAMGLIYNNTNVPFLILDLRNNNGGNDEIAKMVVSNLMFSPIEYEKSALYNPKTEKFDLIQVRKLEPDSKPIPFKGQIIVLTNEYVVSSAESFVLMLKQLPNVKVVGTKTYGSSGNPQPFKITDQITVMIPSWQAFDMKGNPIENKGIEPDIKLEYPEEQYNTTDPLFDYVLNNIVKQALPKPETKK